MISPSSSPIAWETVTTFLGAPHIWVWKGKKKGLVDPTTHIISSKGRANAIAKGENAHKNVYMWSMSTEVWVKQRGRSYKYGEFQERSIKALVLVVMGNSISTTHYFHHQLVENDCQKLNGFFTPSKEFPVYGCCELPGSFHFQIELKKWTKQSL